PPDAEAGRAGEQPAGLVGDGQRQATVGETAVGRVHPVPIHLGGRQGHVVGPRVNLVGNQSAGTVLHRPTLPQSYDLRRFLRASYRSLASVTTRPPEDGLARGAARLAARRGYVAAQ